MRFKMTSYPLFLGMALACSVVMANEAAPAASSPASAGAQAPEEAASGPTEEELLAARPAEFGKFCLFAGSPPSDLRFTVIRKLKVGKQTYGSVKDVLPELVDRAREAGADAIVSYNGSQRFGFFPWRMIRPVVSGTAVKWVDSARFDNCAKQGGTTVEEVLKANKAPAR